MENFPGGVVEFTRIEWVGDSMIENKIPHNVDTFMVDFHGKKMTYREFQERVIDNQNINIQTASGEILSKKEYLKRLGCCM